MSQKVKNISILKFIDRKNIIDRVFLISTLKKGLVHASRKISYFYETTCLYAMYDLSKVLGLFNLFTN